MCAFFKSYIVKKRHALGTTFTEALFIIRLVLRLSIYHNLSQEIEEKLEKRKEGKKGQRDGLL